MSSSQSIYLLWDLVVILLRSQGRQQLLDLSVWESEQNPPCRPIPHIYRKRQGNFFPRGKWAKRMDDSMLTACYFSYWEGKLKKSLKSHQPLLCCLIEWGVEGRWEKNLQLLVGTGEYCIRHVSLIFGVLTHTSFVAKVWYFYLFFPQILLFTFFFMHFPFLLFAHYLPKNSISTEEIQP